jgi:hypothetical protein
MSKHTPRPSAFSECAPSITNTQLEALERAAKRPRGNIYPIPGLKACVADGVGLAIERRGLADRSSGSLRINDAGRAAIAKAEGWT